MTIVYKKLTKNQWIRYLQDEKIRVSTSLPENGGRFELIPPWEVTRCLPEEHLLYYVGHGRFDARMADATHHLQRDSMIWTAPGIPFSYVLPAESKLTLYRFRLKVSHRKTLFRLMPDYTVAHQWHQGRGWFEKIIAAARDTNDFSSGLMRILLAGFFMEFFIHLDQSKPQSSVHSNTYGRTISPHQYDLLRRYIQDHQNRYITPAELAETLGLSADYFSRLFKKSCNQSPRRWILEERIHHAAARLAQSTDSISRIAHDFGYSDVFFFSRQFKQVTGTTPSTYRRNSF